MDALIIFIKNPILGKVKTRLAAAIGDREALVIYTELLRLTRTAALAYYAKANRNLKIYLYYSDAATPHDDWDNRIFIKKTQLQVADLGARMKAAFAEVFTDGAQRAVIIGSDCPHLMADILDAGFAALRNYDVTLGVAEDGGYYLLGLQEMQAILFDEMQWSTSTVATETLRRATENSLTVHLLPTLRDVDTIADWRVYVDEIHQI